MTTWHIREAIRQIAAGGVIAYPTDTVYGLGCDPLNAAAVLQLLALKQRDIEQGVILIASDWQQLQTLLLPVSASIRKRIMKPATGPVTWILPANPDVPVWLRGAHDSLAVRVTSHPVVAELCNTWNGPLVSTSANRHGKHPATTPLGVRQAFDNDLDYILHGPVGSGAPSEIHDGVTGKILR